MAIIFDPKIRLTHLDNYLKQFHLNLTFEEAQIQLLRVRLTGYKLAAEIKDTQYDKSYVDSLILKGYQILNEHWKQDVKDPYEDPCMGQYELLTELRFYAYRDPSNPFMAFIRAEFKTVFIPTLRLLTEFCESKNKYTWDEVKLQLQEIMDDLGVEVKWEYCDAYLDKYMNKVSDLLEISPEKP
ncbi:MAG: hypothetical protein ACXQT4_05405 [Methanotrichaceae archaeon]